MDLDIGRRATDWEPARPASEPAGITCPDNAVFASPIPCRPARTGGWIRPGQVIPGPAAAMAATIGVGTSGHPPDNSSRGRPGLVPSRHPPRTMLENPAVNCTDAMRCAALRYATLPVIVFRLSFGNAGSGEFSAGACGHFAHEPDGRGAIGLPRTWSNSGRKVQLNSGEGRDETGG